MIEAGVCTESLTNFKRNRWVETWTTERGFVFILTNFETGERSVYVGDEENELATWLAVNDGVTD